MQHVKRTNKNYEGGEVNINKWKSMAIKKEKWLALKGLCSEKFRAPASMWEKIFDDYVGFKGQEESVSKEVYMAQLIKKRSIKMTITTADIERVNFTLGGKEKFEVELNQITNKITLKVDNIVRNEITADDAEKLYEKILELVKAEFIKYRDPKLTPTQQ